MSWWRMARTLEDMDGEPYSATCYHGSSFGKETGIFDEINNSCSEAECVWVTPDEEGAEWFAMNWRQETGTPVVFEVPVSLNNALPIMESATAGEIMDAYGCTELSECVPFLQADGFDGWVMDNGQYTDVAVFYGELSPTKVKVLTDKGWTKYMEIEEAREMFGEEE